MQTKKTKECFSLKVGIKHTAHRIKSLYFLALKKMTQILALIVTARTDTQFPQVHLRVIVGALTSQIGHRTIGNHKEPHTLCFLLFLPELMPERKAPNYHFVTKRDLSRDLL